ncbi:unnamed protein product [Orchesella dallaii]|uniref:Uncharacterized protein n=1 Tax=Orchesella dallaii TaxID=48710 RepID=A0ABP1QJD2_9HEXA
MDINGKQVPTQSSYLGSLKKLLDWVLPNSDHRQESFPESELEKAADKERQDVYVLSPVGPDASEPEPNNPDVPENFQRNPETTIMPEENETLGRDRIPIDNEVKNMEVDEEAVAKNGLEQEKKLEPPITAEGERVQLIKNNVVPQVTSNMKHLVPVSSTESGVSTGNLRRSLPPLVTKLEDMTDKTSVPPTRPKSQIKFGPPLRMHYKRPKTLLPMKPFFKNMQNPPPFVKVVPWKGKEIEHGQRKQQIEDQVERLEEKNEGEKKSQGGNGNLQGILEKFLEDEEKEKE